MRFTIKLALALMISGLISSPMALAEITRGPYVQNAGLKEITIMWRTDKIEDSHVLFGTNDTVFDGDISPPIKTTDHELTIGSLNPNTRYYYQIRSGDDQSETGSFWTAAGVEDNFRFVVYGDTRSKHKPHAKIVEKIIAHEPRFAIHTGDLTNNLKDDEIEEFFKIEAKLLRNIVLYPVIGNHDYRHGGSKMAELFSLPVNLTNKELFYSFDYGSAHFLVIDSQNPGAYSANKFQRLAIEADLRRASSNPEIKYIFISMHFPMHSIGGVHGGCEVPGLRNNLGPIFRKYGVSAVFHGHDHYYQRFNPDSDKGDLGNPPGEPDIIKEGVTYAVVGGGGAPLYTPAPPGTKEPMCGNQQGLIVRASLKDYSYLVVDITTEKAEFRLFDTNDKVRDKFIIMPRNSGAK